MRTILIILTLATSLLIACNQSSSAPSTVAAKSIDPVTQKLLELSGSGATDCGRVKTLAEDATQKASDCAMKAAKDKRAFYVAYDMPGLTVGIAGNSQGKLFSIQSETPDNAPAGTKAEVKSAPCPSDLRLAQSGRVTCMTPGAGMGTVSGASPHGGMPPASGENPHGGMGTTKPGTPNPHGTVQPSHPPATTPPPKQ